MTPEPPLSREFRRFLVGSWVSVLGSRITTIALPMLILSLTDSAAAAGLAVFMVTAPSILVYIPAGVLVDRWNVKRTMIASEFGRGLAISAILALLVFHHPNVRDIVICAIIEEILEIFAVLAERRYVATVATSAVMRTEARTHAAVTVGRSLGGLLFEIRPLLPFAADAFSFLVSIATLFQITAPAAQPRRRRSRATRDMLDGLSFLYRDFRARTTITLKAYMTLVSQALIMMFIVEAHGRNLPAVALGLVLACSGIGGWLGSLASSRLDILKGHSRIKLQLVMWAFGLFMLAVSGSSLQVVWMALAMALFGFTGAMANIEFDMYLNNKAPDMLARIASVDRLLIYAASAVGPALGGILIQECGYEWAVCGLLVITLVVGLSSWRAIRAHRRMPPVADDEAVPASWWPGPTGMSTARQSGRRHSEARQGSASKIAS
jgi:MFS family permease